jgi:hypothetical protein
VAPPPGDSIRLSLTCRWSSGWSCRGSWRCALLR